jgi:1-acyl-sn-glycerol-3-phosphate acyltransferase
MRTVIESKRGLVACAQWIFGAPLANARVAYLADSKQEGRAIMSRLCQRFLNTCHISVEMDGPLPPPGRGCVLCYNESSFPDLMAFMVAFLDHVDRAAAADLYKFFPFARAAFARIDFELVQRGNRAATDALITKMVEHIQSGERVAWGGEGRLSGIDGVRRFKVGASLIAIRAGAPVIPVVFHGGHRTMPLGSIRARPGTIRIRIGKPILTSGLTEADARAFADKLQNTLSEMYANAKISGAISSDPKVLPKFNN